MATNLEIPVPVEDQRPPVIEPGHTFHTIGEKVSNIVMKRPVSLGWVFGFLVMFSLMQMLLGALGYLFLKGTGIWGITIPIGWGFAIVNFVWWIGIGHAGTLISAILALLRQTWRNSINRFAEAMTLFAVACAGIFPLVHTGRPWLAYWLFPYPNTMNYWPNFRSPLVWDVFAVSTYLTISLVFWFMGLIPDLATLRDRAENPWLQRIYGLLAMGWRGSARHWHRYETAYLILAALSTPLVLSVHSIVSFDFAVSLIPGWHTTIFPPYFVAGAIFSGFGMVLTLMIPARKWLGLHELVTLNHLDNIAKVLLLTGTMVGYAYSIEFFIAWFSQIEYEQFCFQNRAFGPYAWAYWIMITCNVVSPQFFWFRRIRRNPTALFVISIFVNIGMWFERFVIVCTSMHRDFLPSSWGYFTPTIIDILTYVGTFGLFFTFFLLFARFLPILAISEVKGVMPQASPHHGHGHTHGHDHPHTQAP